MRPRTLPVGAAPILVGIALALRDGAARPLPAAAALATALLLQIGANLANDLFDHERGADGPDRIGPPRAMQLGLFSRARMRGATLAVFAAACVPGLYLVWLGGPPIALLGALALVVGAAYTGGPWPLGYHGLGDLCVFVFFGVVAVCGSYYVQALALPPLVVAASLPMGALATAVLVVNNVRDLEPDRRAGKRTLAVRLGRRGARIEYVALLVLAYAVVAALGLADATSPFVWLPLLTLPRALALARTVASTTGGPPLNRALAETARLELVFALLLCAGLLA
jgi:1,4-dihydroxy-2-naphthoate octaprenyltransferase